MTEHTLISYFSRSWNTLKIAGLIKNEIGGTILEILPKNPYPPDNNLVVEQAKQEVRTGYKPPLKALIEDIASYKFLFVGSPIWWGTMAPPVAAFLAEFDLSGKTILPFCTHGGGGSGTFEADIARLCPGSNIISGFSLNRKDLEKGQSELTSWLWKLELI